MPASEPAVASSTTCARRNVDQLVAGAERTPLAGHGAVAADAEADDVVVKLDVETIARLAGAGRVQPVLQLVVDEPPDLALDRRRP